MLKAAFGGLHEIGTPEVTAIHKSAQLEPAYHRGGLDRGKVEVLINQHHATTNQKIDGAQSSQRKNLPASHIKKGDW